MMSSSTRVSAEGTVFTFALTSAHKWKKLCPLCKEANHLGPFPVEIWLNIFPYLSIQNFVQLRGVASKFKRIIDNEIGFFERYKNKLASVILKDLFEQKENIDTSKMVTNFRPIVPSSVPDDTLFWLCHSAIKYAHKAIIDQAITKMVNQFSSYELVTLAKSRLSSTIRKLRNFHDEEMIQISKEIFVSPEYQSQVERIIKGSPT